MAYFEDTLFYQEIKVSILSPIEFQNYYKYWSLNRRPKTIKQSYILDNTCIMIRWFTEGLVRDNSNWEFSSLETNPPMRRYLADMHTKYTLMLYFPTYLFPSSHFKYWNFPQEFILILQLIIHSIYSIKKYLIMPT